MIARTHQKVEKPTVHIVAGRPGPKRAGEIKQLLDSFAHDDVVSVILEGAPQDKTSESHILGTRAVHVLAPGCPCCIGSLTLNVTLARALRLEHPVHVILGIVDSDHVGTLRQTLGQPPWSGHLAVSG